MAIDTTGSPVPSGDTSTETTPQIQRASDLAALPDAELLKTFGLATTQTPGTGDRAPADSPYREEGSPPHEITDLPVDTGTVPDATAEAQAETAAQQAAREEAERVAAEAAPPVEKRPLQAQFQVYEGEDELEIPDLKLKFKAAGEERELPLDRVVKLAQQGYYNEQRAEEMRQFREQLPQIEDTISSLQQQNEMLLQGWRRVLSGDEDFLEAERQEFLRTQSPEARAQRLEAELAAERGQTRQSQFERQAANFVQTQLVPELQNLEAEHPEVSFEEIVGRFNLLTAPLMVRGQIPPARFEQVSNLVNTELRPWVDAQNEKRISQKKAQTTVVERATATAQAAKRQTARAVMPQGTPATGAEKVVNKPYKTAADILDDLPNIAKLNP